MIDNRYVLQRVILGCKWYDGIEGNASTIFMLFVVQRTIKLRGAEQSVERVMNAKSSVPLACRNLHKGIGTSSMAIAALAVYMAKKIHKAKKIHGLSGTWTDATGINCRN